ncbi:unnamed protein product, partial [Polarella glacialis]
MLTSRGQAVARRAAARSCPQKVGPTRALQHVDPSPRSTTWHRWQTSPLQLSRCASTEAAPLKEVLEAAKEEDDAAASSTEAAQFQVTGQQGVLWFANIYPTKAFRFDFRQMLTHHNHETLIPKLLPKGVEIVKMVPREREGGAFVYFRAPPAFVFQVLRELAEKGDSKDASK